MTNEQLENYIKQSLKSGKTEEDITKSLLTVNWTPEQISSAFSSIKNQLEEEKKSIVAKEINQPIIEKKDNLIFNEDNKKNKTKNIIVNIFITLGIIIALLIYTILDVNKLIEVSLILIGCLVIEKIFSKKIGKDVNNSFNVIIKNFCWILSIPLTLYGIYFLWIGIMSGCQELGGIGCLNAPPILLLIIILMLIAVRLKVDNDNYIKNSKAIIIFVLILIVGSVIYSFFPSTYIKHQSGISDEQKKELDLCYLSRDNLRYSCISDVAKKYQNEQFCEEIPRSGTDWYGGCYQEVAEEKKDPELCKKLSFQDECLYNIAIAKQDSSLCKDIPKGAFSEGCYLSFARSTKDYTFCEQVNEYEKNDCYKNIAISTKNPSLCEKIPITDQLICIESSGGSIKPINYTSHPAAISTEQKKDINSCYLETLKAEDKDKIFKRYYCIYSVAFKYQNEQFCEEIPKIDVWYDDCYFGIAELKNDAKICQKIIDQETVKNCIFDIAVSKNDYSLCESIPRGGLIGYYYENCYFKIAEATKNSSLCSKTGDRESDCLEKTVEK